MTGAERPQIVGRYAIHGRIASGGMASVHFGRLLGPVGFARTVAIKRLHPHLAEEPEFLTAMVDEARVAACIHHPNVVSTLDVVADGRDLLVVMEYVRGESLSRLVRTEAEQGRKVPLPIASAIAADALHGLHAAHETRGDRGEPLGIVHRDVSPQNIVVGIDGQARVIDFGVAKATGRLTTTRQGVIKGKLTYMAPEQLSAGPSGEVSRRADLYAMGIVLWELIAGRRLFVGKDEGALVGQVLAGVQTAPSAHVADVPPELDAVVMKALSPQPERRFETAQAMADALTRAVAPAYPPEVGAWVERVAGAAITARDAVLLEIESGVRSGPDESTRVTGETLETVVSSPSSISVETPMTPGRVSRRAKLAVALGVVVLAAAGVGVLSWQRSAPRAGALSSAAAVSTATALAAAPSASESSTTPAPAPASSSASPAPLQVLPAPSTTVRSRPSPRAPTHGRPPPLATHQTTVDPLAP